MTNQILAIDVLSEILSKVDLEVARIRNKPETKRPEDRRIPKIGTGHQTYDLGSHEEETLRNILTAGLTSAVLSDYQSRGINVRGRTALRIMARNAEMELADRAADLSVGENLPQIGNRYLTDALQNSGYLGFSVRDNSTCLTEEDFKFGMLPTGGRYLDIQAFGLKSAMAKRLAGERYTVQGKRVEDIIATIPRKYKIQDQTYVLDVEKTLTDGGLNGMSAGYTQVRKALLSEMIDPIKVDELQKMYSQLELTDLKEAAALLGIEADD